MLNVAGTMMMLSYEPAYGDLVWSIIDDTGGRVDHVVAGVPDVPPTSEDTDYRGGITDPGEDVGRRPAAVAVTTDGGVRIASWHQHAEEGQLHYARLTPWDGAVTHTYPLPLEGVAGRFNSIVLDDSYDLFLVTTGTFMEVNGATMVLDMSASDGDGYYTGFAVETTDGATGGLVGWVYVEEDASGASSRLVRLNATSADPRALEDWEVTVLSSTPLPHRDPNPCDGACELLELCLRMDDEDRCASALTGAVCDGGCPAHEVCVAEGGEPTCWPQVYPETETTGMAWGTGLYVACAPTPEGAVAAWYDADAGALIATRGPGGAGEELWLDGTPEPLDGMDRGRHVAMTTTAGGAISIVYQDVIAGQVLAMSQSSADQAWVSEVVHDGVVAGGLHALGTGMAATRLGDGREIVVYGDGSTGALWLASRDVEGCWHRVLALSEGTWAWPAVTALGDASVGIAGVAMSLGQDLSAQRTLTTLTVPAPEGLCP